MPKVQLRCERSKRVLIVIFALHCALASSEPVERSACCRTKFKHLPPYARGVEHVTGLISPGEALPQLTPLSVWNDAVSHSLLAEPAQLMSYHRHLQVSPDLRCSSTGMPRGLSLTTCDGEVRFRQHYSQLTRLLQRRSLNKSSRQGRLLLKATIAIHLLHLDAHSKWLEQLDCAVMLILVCFVAKQVLALGVESDLRILGALFGMQLFGQMLQAVLHTSGTFQATPGMAAN